MVYLTFMLILAKRFIMSWLELELGNFAWILCLFLGHDYGEFHDYECGELWSQKICSCKRTGCRKTIYQ